MADKVETPVETPVDLTPEQIKAREADVAADLAKRNEAAAAKEAEPREAEGGTADDDKQKPAVS